LHTKRKTTIGAPGRWLAATLLRAGDAAAADRALARALAAEPALVEHPFARSVGAELARLLDADAGAR
jgi:hypothetical protein